MIKGYKNIIWEFLLEYELQIRVLLSISLGITATSINIYFALKTKPFLKGVIGPYGVYAVIYFLFFAFLSHIILRFIQILWFDKYNVEEYLSYSPFVFFESDKIAILAVIFTFIFTITTALGLVPTTLLSQGEVGYDGEGVNMYDYGGNKLELGENYEGKVYFGHLEFKPDSLVINERVVRIVVHKEVEKFDLVLNIEGENRSETVFVNSSQDESYDVTVKNQEDNWTAYADKNPFDEKTIITIDRRKTEYNNLKRGDCLFATQIDYKLEYYETGVNREKVRIVKEGTIPFLQFGKHNSFEGYRSAGCYDGFRWSGIG